MKTKRNIAFIVELFIMFVILLSVIVIITDLSMKTRQQSIDAGYLTEAVICAENAAEVTSGAKDAAAAEKRLGLMEEASGISRDGNSVTADVAFKPEEAAEGSEPGAKNQAAAAGGHEYTVTIDVTTEKGSTGSYVTKKIKVYHKGDAGKDGKEIYVLDAGDFVKGGAS